MFLRCSVFSTNTDSLEQPTDTSVPPGKGCVSSFCSGQQPGHSAAKGGPPGQLCWPSGTSMTSLPHNSYRKPPTCPLKNSLALPNTDTPELVTGNVHISMSCAVDFNPCLSTSREMLSIFMHRGASPVWGWASDFLGVHHEGAKCSLHFHAPWGMFFLPAARPEHFSDAGMITQPDTAMAVSAHSHLIS